MSLLGFPDQVRRQNCNNGNLPQRSVLQYTLEMPLPSFTHIEYHSTPHAQRTSTCDDTNFTSWSAHLTDASSDDIVRNA